MDRKSLQQQIFFWALALAGFIGFLWLFQPVLLPFVLGIAVAYLLTPIADRLQKKGVSRFWASLGIIIIFLLCILSLFLLTIPVLYRELNSVIQDFPKTMQQAWEVIRPYFEEIKDKVEDAENGDVKSLLGEGASSAPGLGKWLLDSIKAGGAFVNTLISVFVLAPIVAFFVLKDWPFITKWLEDLMPKEHKPTILDLLKQMDQKLSGFVRGQLLIAFILAVAYALALSLAGLNYAILIAIAAGILNLIPMLGSTAGLLISAIVAWIQTGDWQFTLLIAGVFLAGQLIEANFLTPKLLGDKVGLHPLWVFFALMAGGALGGIVGMLIAVPLAASIGVLIGFAIKQYKASAFYKNAGDEQ